MSQFGSFDGLDNRRDLFHLLGRLGGDAPEPVKAEARCRFLKRLLLLSTNGFAAQQVRITPGSLTDSYFLLTAITGSLGVPIEQAARLLEREAKKA